MAPPDAWDTAVRVLVSKVRAALQGLARDAEAARRREYVHQVREVDGKLLVRLDDPDRDNPDLIRALVAAGADIQFVGELRQTLEDVYLRLVGTSDATPGGGAGSNARPS